MCSHCTCVAYTVLIVIDILGCAPLLCMPAACYCSLTFGTFYRNKYRSMLKIAVQLSLKFFSLDGSRNILHIKVFLMHFGGRIKAHGSLRPTLRPHGSSDLEIE